ncbi:3-phosphoshikimate 1-carboxyvinyltransferase [Fibrobacterota bacterium]
MTASELFLRHIKVARGEITPPGSKSIANRILPLAALGKGTITLDNLPGGDDVTLMKKALHLLGVEIKGSGSQVHVTGLGGPFKCTDSIKLDLGNSGTATRFLTALLCTGHGKFQIDGVPRLRERPIGDLVDSLHDLSTPKGNKRSSENGTTEISYQLNPGFPPLNIHARGLSGGIASVKGNISSQFLTGLLMTLPLCQNPSKVLVQGPLVSPSYVKLTLDILEDFKVEIIDKGFREFTCSHPEGFINPSDYMVEADASSASYFLAAGAIAGDPVTVHGVGKGTRQYHGEGQFAHILKKMGAKVEIKEKSITVSHAALKGIDANMNTMSDTGMTLAVLALFAEGPTHISHIGNWRLKETDRLHAMAAELRKLGAGVEEGNDSLTIHPPETWSPAEINTYDDHRMAMSFALTAFSGVPVTILDPDCVSKTFPGFFNDFSNITGGQS